MRVGGDFLKRKAMTTTEKSIYRLISTNPMISQEEIAAEIGVSRSSASVHISNLIKKGYIAGRSYVINPFENVVFVGCAMVDLYGKSTNPLLPSESNPGLMQMHVGGVSRNIAENLARLGVQTSLITSLGDDPFGEMVKQNCTSIGIDITHSYYPENTSQTTYLAILDNDGEMNIALSDTTALQMLTPEFLEKKESIIRAGEVIVVDTSLSQRVLEYMAETYHDRRIVVDPVSIGMSKKIKHILGKFHTLKCNKNEAEFLSDTEISDEQTLNLAAKRLIDKGLNQVYITTGKSGVYYMSENESGHCKSISVDILNATGAGDAFSAGVVYCMLANQSMQSTAQFSTCMSAIALQSPFAVSDAISIDNVNQLLKEKERTL